MKKDKIKRRDPNWELLQQKRRSGAGGAHRDKRQELKAGGNKHKRRLDLLSELLELNTPTE